MRRNRDAEPAVSVVLTCSPLHAVGSINQPTPMRCIPMAPFWTMIIPEISASHRTAAACQQHSQMHCKNTCLLVTCLTNCKISCLQDFSTLIRIEYSISWPYECSTSRLRSTFWTLHRDTLGLGLGLLSFMLPTSLLVALFLLQDCWIWTWTSWMPHYCDHGCDWLRWSRHAEEWSNGLLKGSIWLDWVGQMALDGHECMGGPTWASKLLGVWLRACDNVWAVGRVE